MWDAVKEILEASKVRVKNPLAGAFIFAWLAYNWSFWVYWFDDGLTSSEKVKAISSQVLTAHSFWVPVSLAGAYVVVMPWMSAAVARVTESAQILSLEYSKKLRLRQVEAQKEANLDEIRKIKSDIEGLVKQRDGVLRHLRNAEYEREQLGSAKKSVTNEIKAVLILRREFIANLTPHEMRMLSFETGEPSDTDREILQRLELELSSIETVKRLRNPRSLRARSKLAEPEGPEEKVDSSEDSIVEG